MGNDFKADFDNWMDSVGLLGEHNGDAWVADTIALEQEQQLNTGTHATNDEDATTPPTPPPPIPTPPPPTPWKMPNNIEMVPSGRGYDIMDLGGSSKRCVGRVGAPMAVSGAIRAVCKLPGHSCNSKNQCCIWLTAPGHVNAALSCIGERVNDAMVEGSDQTKHSSAAAVQAARFRDFRRSHC